jgi:hypothetical protein
MVYPHRKWSLKEPFWSLYLGVRGRRTHVSRRLSRGMIYYCVHRITATASPPSASIHWQNGQTSLMKKCLDLIECPQTPGIFRYSAVHPQNRINLVVSCTKHQAGHFVRIELLFCHQITRQPTPLLQHSTTGMKKHRKKDQRKAARSEGSRAAKNADCHEDSCK